MLFLQNVKKMKNTFSCLIIFFLVLVLTPLFSFAEYLDVYFLTLRRNQGRTVGNKLSYTTFSAVAFPFHREYIWPFLDFRIHRFDKHDKYAGNVGLGCRFASTKIDKIFGINAYYDYKNRHHHNFHQLGLGFEILSKCWNFRLNGYLPFGRKRVLESSCFFDEFIGNFFFQQKNYKRSLSGVDFEIESYLTRICCMDLYFGIGAYYYRGDRCERDIYGTEYNLTTWYCNYMSFGINVTHDCRFKTRVQGELSISFPFKCFSECDRILFLPVRRREIVSLEKSKRFNSNFGCSGGSSCDCR